MVKKSGWIDQQFKTRLERGRNMASGAALARRFFTHTVSSLCH
jgi:hypothetical protein